MDDLDCEGREGEEPLVGVPLTHFVQGRSPLNPFPGARPRRKVPDNLQEPNNRRGHSSRRSEEPQIYRNLQLMFFSLLSERSGPKTQMKEFSVEALMTGSYNPLISPPACLQSFIWAPVVECSVIDSSMVGSIRTHPSPPE